MTGKELRQKYLEFFVKKGHKVIPPAPLILQNDPTTLFTSSGMQPLVPYLLGQPHPQGKLLVDSQPCFRGQGFFDDTENIGNNRHTTFFEMLGNWSLGDYFKEKQLEYFFTFLTDKNNGLGLDPQRLYVGVFAGAGKIPKDEESIAVWKKLFADVGVKAKEGERIVAYGVEKSWWSRSGPPDKMPVGELGGPDSEVFYRFDVEHDPRFGKECHPNCDCNQFLEIGNSVFIQYIKQADGTFKELPQKNVDFGGGLERQLAVVCNDPRKPDIFKTDLFWPIIEAIEGASGKTYEEEANRPAMRVVADHFKGAVFMINDGLTPSNKDQGYILRRLLRRAIIKARSLEKNFIERNFDTVVERILGIYDGIYFNKDECKDRVASEIGAEIKRFTQTLERGLRRIEKMPKIDGKTAFDLYQTYGFPLELTKEVATEKGISVDDEGFKKAQEEHQKKSRAGAEKKFAGGLADHSEAVTKYHTVTHLLHQALRDILGDHINQVGSNLTAERLRFDFTHPQALSKEEVKKVEKIINEKIREDLPVKVEMMTLEAAKKKGALAFFTQKYGEIVKVYFIGDYSIEVCGGPHVFSTGAIGSVKIIKEQAVGAGRRRIYAQLT